MLSVWVAHDQAFNKQVVHNRFSVTPKGGFQNWFSQHLLVQVNQDRVRGKAWALEGVFFFHNKLLGSQGLDEVSSYLWVFIIQNKEDWHKDIFVAMLSQVNLLYYFGKRLDIWNPNLLKLVCIGVLSEDFGNIFDFLRFLAICHLGGQFDEHTHEIWVFLKKSNNRQKFAFDISLELWMLLDSENQLESIFKQLAVIFILEFNQRI